MSNIMSDARGRGFPKVARRRFFGLVAAPVAAGALPVGAAPIGEMVEADIAPVVPPIASKVTPWGTFTTQDVTLSVSEWMESYTRPQMIRLAREIDDEVRKACYG